MHPEILASGSLDHEVRLWNSSTSECIGSRDFCNLCSNWLLCPHSFLPKEQLPEYKTSIFFQS